MTTGGRYPHLLGEPRVPLVSGLAAGCPAMDSEMMCRPGNCVLHRCIAALLHCCIAALVRRGIITPQPPPRLCSVPCLQQVVCVYRTCIHCHPCPSGRCAGSHPMPVDDMAPQDRSPDWRMPFHPSLAATAFRRTIQATHRPERSLVDKPVLTHAAAHTLQSSKLTDACIRRRLLVGRTGALYLGIQRGYAAIYLACPTSTMQMSCRIVHRQVTCGPAHP
ncbi:hypothetical protein EDB81DRAFT_11244 [Dactylonectria macrodidyma]|uniref:Uncharacterized protein n=1 Tax=Dactylonectria macrodidyma TaxID=307937 RepID=A0A9P9FT84_9HYPO|nr:hypothetical protein EDB81DRAFT_11244 [Dactylonectria macrodidyma]